MHLSVVCDLRWFRLCWLSWSNATESKKTWNGTRVSWAWTGLLLCALHRHGWWAGIWCTREQSIENWGSFGNLSKVFKNSAVRIFRILEKLMSLGWVWHVVRIVSATSFCNLPCKEVYITSIQALQTGVILAKESQQIIFTCQIHGSRCLMFDAVQSCISTSLLLCIHFRSCSVSLPTEIYLADTCDTLAFASVAPIQGSRRVLRFAVKLCMRIPIKKVPIMFRKEIPTEINAIHHQTIQPCLRRARTASVPIQSRGSPTWEVILDASDLSAGRDYRVCVDQDCWNKTGTSWKLESLRSRMCVCVL